MAADSSLRVSPARHPSGARTAISAVSAPLVGLAYVLALPCIGVALLLYLGGQKLLRARASLRHHPSHNTSRS